MSNSSQNEHVFECPNCSYPILTDLNSTSVKCPCCSSVVNVNQPSTAENIIAEKVSGIKNISAAKSYIEFLFDSYNWDDFSNNASVYTIPEVDAVLKNMQTNEGNDKETWKLSFHALQTCISKKIEYINKNIDKVVEKYINDAEENGCHNDYDILKEGVYLLKRNQPKLLSDLQHYIDYTIKTGGKESEKKEMEIIYNQIADDISKIEVSTEFKQHPRVIEKMGEKMAALEQEYEDRGLDARSIYATAVSAYQDDNYHDALVNFSKIANYRDAGEYLSKLTTSAILKNRIIYYNGKIFYYSCGFVNGRAGLIDRNARISNEITKFEVYGENVFFFENTPSGVVINSYNINTVLPDKKQKKLPVDLCDILYGTVDDYLTVNDYPNYIIFVNKYDPILNKNEKDFYLKTHKIQSSLKFSKKANINFKKFHDVILFDKNTKETSLVIEGVRNIIKVVGDIIYYIAPLPVMKKNDIIDLDGYGLFAYNMTTREIKQLITGNSTICDVASDKSVIFTRDDHGETNKTIYTKRSIDDPTEFEVVKNVYEYYKLIKGKIFYLIGNSNIKSLCSINPDGTNYKEVMKYMKEIAFSDEDWLYITRGNNKLGYRTLYRLSIEGGEPQKVAFSIHDRDLKPNNLKIFEGYLYYTNYENILCKVRLNGTGYQELVKDVADVFSITNGKIFYIANDGKINGKQIKSLYNMEADGSNRQKLIHNFDDITKIDDTHFLYLRDEELDSYFDLYKDITDKKIIKVLRKMEKKYNKKKRNPNRVFPTISVFDCDGCYSESIAYDCCYPTAKELKNEMKAELRR